MADGIKVTFDGFDKIRSDLENVKQTLQQQSSLILNKGAQDIVTRAKQYAPVNDGILSNAISADTSKPLDKRISVNSPYAAFMEFGTGLYAAQYVGSLPGDWQQYASQFKGQKGGGTLDDMVLALAQWIHSKGLAGTYSVKTQRRTSNKYTQQIEDLELAYVIMLSILRKGVKAHPFLYPAFKEVVPGIIEEFKKLFGK